MAIGTTGRPARGMVGRVLVLALTLVACWSAVDLSSPARAQGAARTAAQAATAVVLAPHRAVYDITLARAHQGSGVADLAGRMVYELTGSACEGYTQNMRFVTSMSGGEGKGQLNDLRSSSFEDHTGRRLRFNSSQYKDEQLSESTQGDAQRDAPEGGVKIELSRPKKKTVTVASRVYFPVEHSIAVLSAARAGKSLFTSNLYDGSEKGEKVYSTTAAIGRLLRAGQLRLPASLKNGEVLDQRPSWPVSISYFEPGSEKKDAVPTYELAFRFFDNGVSTGLFIDYGEFAIKGDLKELTFLPESPCAPIEH